MRKRVLAAGMVALVTACSGVDPQSPIPTSTASSAQPVFTSAAPSEPAARLYPYELSWQADELLAPWRFATTAWDGEARIDHGNQYTDSAETSDGSLFAFGYPTDGTAEELRDLVAQQAAEGHGCDAEPSAEEPLAGGEADGIYGVYACGSRTVQRWQGVHNGFGLFVGLIVDPGVEVDQAATNFKERVRLLEWTN